MAGNLGEPGHQKPSEQRESNRGPVPEGEYSFPLDRVQQLDQWNQLLGYVGLGKWPGGVRPWGTQRAELVPSASMNLFGRSRFFMHGGFQPGSRGCIDLGPNEDAYFAAVRALGGKSHDVIVDYDPRLETETHPLAAHNSFDVRDYFSRPLLRHWQEQGLLDAPDANGGDSTTTVPPNVRVAGNYLAANGVPVTHRSMYLASVYGPQRIVDAINNCRAASLPAPLPNEQTQRQIRSWVQGWHGIAAAAEAAAPAGGGTSGAADGGPDDWIVPSYGQQQ